MRTHGWSGSVEADRLPVLPQHREWLPKDKHMGLLLMPGRAGAFSQTVTSDVA